MNKIIYYVASSLDGFISGPNEDISLFVSEGDGVAYYLADLKNFKTVIMGRKTYEFGYKYGMKPGDPAYPHMEHYIFSESMVLNNAAANVHVMKPDIDQIKKIRDQSETDVYLCGGGEFAGWLLDHGMIDQLKLKVSPIVLGSGVPLFGNSTTALKMKLVEQKSFEHGMRISTFQI